VVHGSGCQLDTSIDTALGPSFGPSLDEALADGRLPAGRFAVSPHHWDHPRTTLGIRVMAEYAAEHGHPFADVLAGTGLAPEGLDAPGAGIEAAQEIAAARNLLGLLGDRPGAGLEVGRRFHLTTYGLYGFALLSMPVMLDVTRTGLRLAGLTFAFSTIAAEITDDGLFALRLHGTDVPADVRRFLVERDLAAVVTMQQELLGRSDFPLLSIRSAFPAAAVEPLTGVPVDFGSAETALIFEPQHLAQELPLGSPQTARECIAQCEQLLEERLDRRGAAAAVRARLRRLHGREDGIDAAAQALHMTDRTLRRRLAAEGTSYRRLVDEVRSGIAWSLLDEDEMSATEVARHLGFGDLPAFLRAQRRWRTGVVRKGQPPVRTGHLRRP
jgi:AraC-like DNA-binding protein